MRRLASCFAVGLALVLQPAAARADLFEEIRARGLVRIGTVEQLPYFHREGKRLRGFIVDLGNRLARDLNVRAEFKTAKSHNLVERLKSGDVDLVAGGVPITPERAIEIVFSPPISRTPVELVTRAVTLRPIGGPAVPAEPEAVIAVVSGTEAAAAAEAAFPDGRLLRKHSEADVIAALAIGEATVAALGLPWSAMLLDKNPRAFARSAGPLLTLVEAFALSPSEARFAQLWTIG